MMRSSSAANGFTLIEVVIALMLLAFLSFFTAQSIQKAVQAKQKIQGQIDREVELREGMGILIRDLQLAFNYRDISIELYNQSLDLKNQAAPTPSLAPGVPTPTPTPPELGGIQGGDIAGADKDKKKEDKIVTQFVGDAAKINFSSLSNIRTSPDETSSDQAEVGYYLERCKSRTDSQKTSDCLWRRVSPFIDENIAEGGTQTPILENVASLQFRYMGPGFTEEWVRSWASDGTGDAAMKGNFPFAVEVTLKLLDTRFDPPKEISMTSVAQLRFPNNPKPKEAAGATETTAPQ